MSGATTPRSLGRGRRSTRNTVAGDPRYGPAMPDTDDSRRHRREEDAFRDGGISYLRIPAPSSAPVAAFYRGVFGWTIREDADHPAAFRDGTGHVIGHFMPDLAVVGEAGVLPYVYVSDLDAALERVTAHGGTIVGQPYPEGDLWVAAARDPAGNFLGLWQHGERTG
jgi:predicted enzyme related to lactoylglutathione lyase